MRAPRRRSRPRTFSRFHALTALFLLLGIAAPVVPVAPVAAAPAAQRGGNPPPLPAPNRVVAIGSFQTALGCPADYDPTCGLTELTDAGGGSWSGVFAVPPGAYGVRVVASGPAGDFSLGAGGDPDAADVPLQVGPDAAGAYIAYDAVSGEVTAEPVGQQATLVTDLGDRVAMAPTRGGGYEAFFDAQPGNYGFQILFGDEPVAQDTIALDAPRRVYVAVDEQGSVVGLDTVRGTVLTVTKTDAAGAPLPGACFAVLTAGEGLVGQGCDADDGEDGSTRLRFPNGVAPDLYALREVATPDGQEPAEPQQVELGPGQFEAEAVAAGGEPAEDPGEEPAEETAVPEDEDEATVEPDGEETPADEGEAAVAGRVLLRAVDEDGAPLPGACFVLVELGIEACDDDADGDVVFENVPPGIYTVSESAAPEGYAANADGTIDVGPDGARVRIPHEPADDQSADDGIVPVGPDGGATETAEPEPTEAVAAEGSLALSVRDEDGGAVTGSCFALAPRDGNDPIERCDEEDGADDGELLFARVPAGRYQLEETRTPDGREPVAPEDVTIGEGEAAALTVTSPAGAAEREAEGPGRLLILVVDQEGNPVSGSCFDLEGPATFADVCDQGDDGRLNFPDIPSGEYEVRQTQAAPDHEPAADETVTVLAGETEELTLVNRRTEAERQVEEAGAVAIAAIDAAGNPAAGGCYALAGGEGGTIEVCDDGPGDADGDAGAVLIEDVTPGDYEVTEIRAPAGLAPSAEAATVTVAGGETARVRFAAEAPVEEPTEEPTPTEEPEEPDAGTIQATDTGRLVVLALSEDGDPIEGICVGLVGPSPVDRLCDQDAGDADDEPGTIRLGDLLPGAYVLQIDVPEGTEPVADRPLEVSAGTTERVELALAAEAEETPEPAETPEAEPGTLVMVAQDDEGRLLGGACYTVANGGQTFGPFCDENANGDVIVNEVTPGEQTVTQTTAPADAGPPEDAEQTADLASGAETTLTFVHAPATAALRIVVRDEAGDPAGGGCYEAVGPQTYAVCDDGPGDADPAPGVVLIADVEPGDYTLAEARPATGFAPVEGDQDVTVETGEPTTVELTVGQAPATGDLLVVLEADGQSFAGACVELSGPATIGPVCDEGTAETGVRAWRMPAAQEETFVDGDPRAGFVLIEDVPEGDYTLTVTDLPAELQAPAPETVTVRAGQTTEVEATPTQALGTLVILVVDQDNDPVGETCFDLEGPANFADVCDRGNDGRLNIPDIPAGDYTVRQTRTAPDHDLAGEETVTVPAGGSEDLTVLNRRQPEPTPVPTATAEPTAEPTATAEPTEAIEPTAEAEPTGPPAEPTEAPAPTAEPVAPVGTLVVVNVGPDGEVIGGGCFSLAGPAEAVCDNGPEDGDADPGVVAFVGIPAGTYTVTQTAAPAGFAAAPAQTVEVVAGDEVVVELASAAAEPETGSVRLEALDAEGNPVEGRCFRLTRDGERLGPFCDQGAEDAEPAPAILVLENLRAGAYEAAPEPVEGEEESEEAATGQTIGGPEQRTFTVRGNQAPVRVVVVVRRQQPREGDLVVALRDELDRPLAGACFALVQDGDAAREVCDDRGGDGDGNRGQIRFDAVRNGAYLLTQTQAPAGYQAAADREVEIIGGRVRRETIANQPVPETTGGLAVLTVAEGGGELPGACYALLRGTGTIGPICDADDGDDGRTTFADVDAGAYVLRQTTAPSADYAPAADRALLVVAGETREERIANRARPGRVLVTTLDEDGALLGGACYALIPDGTDEAGYELCDDDASDGEKTPGTVLLEGVAPNNYLVRQTRAAAGYRTAADQSASVLPNRRVDLVFQDDPIPPPPRRGNLTVFKVDETGQDLAGACFALLQGEVTIAGPRCDAADGANDGTTTFRGVGVGDYALRETRRPAAGYEPVEDLAVTVELDRTVEVTVENTLRPGRIAVRKTDGDGDPLRDACFELAPGDVAGCTDRDGLLAFDGLAPGTYTLTETDAPPGYLGAAPVEGIVVNPGATTTVDVVNELAPPPPDTGSIQIFSYFCPAGDAGEGTEFVDASDAGGGRLARTAGCTLGDAGFSLVATSGEGGLGEFGTGPDGRYQATLLAGDYTLTELAPDLPGDSAEAVTVFVNQLTTVVVLNFVAPPAPEPAAIGIVKYTCAPGFQGTVFADFAQFCTDAAGLTNNVTFRLSGEERARAVTGDGGRQGETSFEDLTVGRYTLREEPPAANLTVYAFCGVDPDAPDLRSVGPSLNLRLESGQRTTCFWFNVPERIEEETGTIVVQKYGCAVERAPANFDWYEECDRQGAGVRFSLAVVDGTDAEPFDVQATDRDGLVRFAGLDPGTYALKEVGAAWCRAESDSVDARGNVVVRANQRANVFIFNCLGTKRPPNTGAGPLAYSAGAVGSGAALGMVLGFGWPLAGLAAYAVRRRRWAA